MVPGRVQTRKSNMKFIDIAPITRCFLPLHAACPLGVLVQRASPPGHPLPRAKPILLWMFLKHPAMGD